MIEVTNCENCKVNPAQHLDNLCDSCEQAMIQRKMAEVLAAAAKLQAEGYTPPAKKSSKRK